MLAEIDHGVRCPSHTGEVFPPRCSDCDELEVQFAAERLGARLKGVGFVPGSECAAHKNYPLPCARCQRDAEGTL